MLISGDQDELIPPAHMKALMEVLPTNALNVFVSLPGHHNDTPILAGEAYYSTWRKFLSSIISDYAQHFDLCDVPPPVEDEVAEEAVADLCAALGEGEGEEEAEAEAEAEAPGGAGSKDVADID